MKTFLQGISVVLAVVLNGYCGRETVFIGLSGDQVPAVQKTLFRYMQEQLLTMPDVNLVESIESRKLQAKADAFHYPTITPAVLASLKRTASDSSLVVWGMVKEYSVAPARRYFFEAVVKGSITIELTIYNLANRSYAFIGDAKAKAMVSKGFIFWFGPVEKAIAVSATDRTEIFEKLAPLAAKESGRIVQTVLDHEASKQDKEGKMPKGIATKSVDTAATAVEETTNEDQETLPEEDNAPETQPSQKNEPGHSGTSAQDTTGSGETDTEAVPADSSAQ